jgi:DNA-binding response OmpR family regulator
VNRRVVVADDDPKFASVVVRLLERHGYHCVVASSGAEALAAVDTLDPAAVVLDVMMPPPDGFEVCRTLRRTGWTGPVIMATAGTGADDHDLATTAGADILLRKPFPLKDLLAAVTTLI